ncbi:M20 family metallopeptidase [Azospirillum canadense]|uniref:M20 family metallopeptidase n=1 Tax=Azospirillum canadense TaxID=403962 RepID=UPI00222769D3|nr:M20 family metallopeptidase [Azospirillum canadense]MCW2241548.1 succinyl-diaminopimelate desuccinylase [Azospirillum canadense]
MTLSSTVALTQALVRQNTINPPGNERRCADLLAKRLEDNGFTVTVVGFGEGRASLVARIGGQEGKLPIAFTGHIDTVPLGMRDWTQNPFGGDIDGDKLYGRGSSDMKAGVAAFVEACIAHRATLESGPGALLVITAAEETGCEGAFHLCNQPGLLGKAGALVVAEPTSNHPLVGHKGALWLRAVAEGVTAHGSMPEKGVNAVAKAARAVVKLDDFDFNERRHEVLGSPTLNVGTFHGGINVNSVPDRAEIGLDIRTVPGQTHARVKEALGSFLGSEVAMAPIIDVEAVWTDPENAWIRRVFAIMEPFLGEPPVVKGATYFTDASALAPALGGLPTVILGPGEAAMAHQTDEYCLVSRIDQAVEAYGRIIEDWCTP